MKTKICLRCHKEKLISLFTRDKSRSDGYHPYCKCCKKNYYKTRSAKRRENTFKIKSMYKCINCGETDVNCLDFHHINPKEKDVCIAVLCSLIKPIQEIQHELKKCICLCSNCHRKFHAYNWKYENNRIIKGE